jgi:hypothetical protein
MVERWMIRMPLVGRVNSPGRVGTIEDRVLGFEEEGAEIVQATIRSRAVYSSTPYGVVRGLVFDSLRMNPAVGAEVSLSGTGNSVDTDGEGFFRFPAVAAGKYRVTLGSSAYGVPGTEPPSVEVEVSPGDSSSVVLVTPSAATILAATCGTATEDTESGLVAGWVVSETGSPSPGGMALLESTRFDLHDLGNVARPTSTGRGLAVRGGQWVMVSEQTAVFEIIPDDDGAFAVCGVPFEVPLTLRRPGGDREADIPVRISRDRPVLVGLRIGYRSRLGG